MPDFSVIVQDPGVRSLVQDNILERAFHDALFPRLMFRSEATPQLWPGQVGDQMTFTGAGLIKPKGKPLKPGTDPTPSQFSSEQWSAQAEEYADTIDTHMPTSMVAIANLFYRNSHQIGLSAAQSLNRIARNKLYNAGLSGHTVADGAQTSTTLLRVKRLNGLTRARRPDLAAGSPVRFDPVSTNNPLKIKVFDNGSEVSRTVVGFTPDAPGDEIGPGVLTLNSAVTSVADRGYVIAEDRTYLVRVGGGFKVDDIGSNDLVKMADIRSAIARFRNSNVPEFPDGRFHCHMDPTSEAQIFSDTEWQSLNRSLPDYYMYKQFAVGEVLGTVFLRDSECPQVETVDGGTTAAWSDNDQFGGEVWNNGNISTGVKLHQMLFVGQGLLNEYYMDLSGLITEAGMTGKVAEPRITNNSIEVFSDRIQMIIRAPLDRLQQMVATSWRFIGDWPARTDVTTGDVARYKRACLIQHGE